MVKLIFRGDDGGGTFACQKMNFGCLNYLFNSGKKKKKKKKKNDVENFVFACDRCAIWFCNSVLNTFFLTLHGQGIFGLAFQHVQHHHHI